MNSFEFTDEEVISLWITLESNRKAAQMLGQSLYTDEKEVWSKVDKKHRILLTRRFAANAGIQSVFEQL